MHVSKYINMDCGPRHTRVHESKFFLLLPDFRSGLHIRRQWSPHPKADQEDVHLATTHTHIYSSSVEVTASTR